MVSFPLSELTEEAKADLLEFEEKERMRKQGRFGGRGRGGGMGGSRGGGGGGRPPVFRMGDFCKDGGAGRGRMNQSRPLSMPVNLGMQVSAYRSSESGGYVSVVHV